LAARVSFAAEIDPAIDLDVVSGQPRPGDYRYALSNSLAFGGSNVALVFGRY
jgi:beta-ketoacyl ACP synthase